MSDLELKITEILKSNPDGLLTPVIRNKLHFDHAIDLTTKQVFRALERSVYFITTYNEDNVSLCWTLDPVHQLGL